MANITFNEASGVNDSIYGKSQAPIRQIIEARGEALDKISVLPKIFTIEKSNQYAEKLTGMTGMEGFYPVGESGAHPVDGMREGYSKTLEHVTWKDKFAISREMIDDSKAIDLRKKPVGFMKAWSRTREYFGAALLGGAIGGGTTATFRGKVFSAAANDGLCLFSTAHTSITGGSTQSNAFSNAFSNDALALAECAMQNFAGDNGEILDVVPDTIIIPNQGALKKAVFGAIGADTDPDTANNGFNYTYGRWNVIVWPYLNQFITSGTAPWIIGASQYNEDNGGAVWYDRTALEVKSRIDDETDDNIWQGYARFIAGFNDWRAFACGGISGATTLS